MSLFGKFMGGVCDNMMNSANEGLRKAENARRLAEKYGGFTDEQKGNYKENVNAYNKQYDAASYNKSFYDEK